MATEPSAKRIPASPRVIKANPEPDTSSLVTKTSLLEEAPPLYGWTPSVQEIEDFRKKELEWRNKLKQAL